MTSPSSPRGTAAIVTGAARGIGRAIALRLAQDGYDIAVNDIALNLAVLETLAEEIKSKGRKAIVITGDVSQEDAVQTLVDKSVAELGELYIMVANAGIVKPGGIVANSGTVVNTSLEAWERVLSVNLTGVFLCYRAAARQMLKQGHGGRIIGASSAYGKRAGADAAAYSSSKFGIRGLTQALATELAKEHITVNAYAPGFIDTPLVSNIVEETGSGSTDEKAVNKRWNAVRAACPMNRLGTPENVAGLVSYMVSDAGDFMTGQSVSVNGGMFYD